MKKLILCLALSVLLPVAAWAGSTNNGDGTTSYYFCNDTVPVNRLMDSIVALSEDALSPAWVMFFLAVRDASVVTDGPTTTTYCGTLATGKSEFTFTIQTATGAAVLTPLVERFGFVDVNPADNLDDNTGESKKQYADRIITEDIMSLVVWVENFELTPPPTYPPFTDTP